MNWSATIALVVTILLAVSGYVVKYVNDLRLAQHRARLERINRQLSEFYGPLFALSYVGSVAWAAADSEIRPHKKASYGEQPLSTDEAAVLRLWMTTVLMPLNRRLVDLILNRSDLLRENEMPKVLLRVCANVLAYEAVLKRWEDGDFSEHWSVISFPGPDLSHYAQESFAEIKQAQTELLDRLRIS